ncbi:hypothetical protein N7T98_26015, partial [Pseudomonas syringae pv. tomato]|uniref:hypothetical protein n=1 Tax=Pseudomonas syringae group genomosp. 3 TaxID=251701 RepID=UPI0022A6ADC0
SIPWFESKYPNKKQNEDYMKKHKFYSQETQEEKEQRWAKLRKAAKSFAKQAGLKVVRHKKTQSNKFDY